MKPERWQRIDRLLELALEQEPDRRSVFLDEACQGDATLRQEVESLLSAYGKTADFIEAGPVGATAGRISVAAAHSLMGRQLAHYQILTPLGEGGMGIVYKAHDTHLDRFVAIKVLPHELMADPDRKRRFVQEAKAASALNHPNIITVHDIASESNRDFIVMEHVEGKTLGQLIPRRGLKLHEALKYAIQIADALAKAQAAGIIHRDLKPGNIMVGEGGLVKVLDFGLAKLTERPHVGEEELTQSILPWTDEGMILGTASYMSPEQAAGKPVDARSDIFSFGSVLYEMVTGQRAFQGNSKMSTLAAILNQEPKPASEISLTLPHDLENIIHRCLRKDPERRFQHMADLKIFLQEVMEKATSSGPPETAEATTPGSRRVVVISGVCACIAVLAFAVWLSRSFRKSDAPPVTAVPLTTYPGHERSPSFSPDGSQVAFSWNGEKQNNFDIYVKMIGADDQPSRLTTDRAQDSSPAWSPDGRWIAFLRDLGERKAAVLLVPSIGGQERKLGEVYKPLFSLRSPMTWSPQGESLVIADKESESEAYGLFVLSIESREKRRLMSVPTLTGGEDGPAFSPDGRTVAFVGTGGGLYLLPVTEDLRAVGEPKMLPSGRLSVHDPAWVAGGREIIFSAGFRFGLGGYGNLLWRVNASGSGEPQRLSVGEIGLGLSISRQRHRLVYSREVADINIWRVEISGQRVKASNPERFISSTHHDTTPQISPDGKKVVFSSNRTGRLQIWICDPNGSNPVQLTFSSGESSSPRFSPDSRWVSFDSNTDGQWEVYVVDSNGGTPRQLTSHPADDTAPSWSHDGKSIYFGSNRGGGYQVWKMSASGEEPSQITQKGGFLALESPDGKFVYYAKGRDDRSIWKVPSQGGEETQILGPIGGRNFDVAKDGIYFIPEPGSSNSHSIRFFSFRTTEIKTIASIENPWASYISVSPDGRWLLYPQLDMAGSDLMLVENFR